MNVSEMVNHVNRLTDEDMASSIVIPFLNDGVARINAECEANYPFLKAEEDTEYVLPETWQRLLLCVFAAGRVKENDSSQFEYMDFYSQFDASMNEFKMKYTIPDEYKENNFSDTEELYFGSYWRWG